MFAALLFFVLVAIAGFWAFALAAILSFGPAYFYLKSIRDAEKIDKEPWGALRLAFIWGAVSGVFYAMILNGLGGSLVYVFTGNSEEITFVVSAVVIAPIVEEFVKPIVMFRNSSVRKEIDEIEDGIVYGAACGLGFGATENILYGLSEGAVKSGFLGIIFVLVLRTLSSILLHLTATSFTGYGISKYLVGDESFVVVIKYYILAVLIHAAWNAAAVTGSPFILLFSIVLAIGGLEFSKRRIRELDLVGSNVASTDIRAEAEGGDWWNNSRNKWDNHSKAGEVSKPIYTSSTSTNSAEEWASNIDLKQTAGAILFLLLVASSYLD